VPVRHCTGVGPDEGRKRSLVHGLGVGEWRGRQRGLEWAGGGAPEDTETRRWHEADRAKWAGEAAGLLWAGGELAGTGSLRPLGLSCQPFRC